MKPNGYRQFNTAYVEIPKKQGKQLALDTKIPTPNGFTTMGDIRVGDTVFDENGQPCRVVAKSDVDDTEQAYRLTFRDGSSIVAGERHLWNVDYIIGKPQSVLWTTGDIYRRTMKYRARYADNDKEARRPNPFNHLIDTVSMLPYIMPGSVIAIALVIGFGRKPIVLTGTLTVMIIAVIIRRLPYTTRSATATLMQISMSIEEAALSLGSSKINTFFKITVPMMSSGIVSGAILSWVSIVTEVSSAAILYNNRSITLTVGTYAAVSRGNVGEGAAFAAVTTVLTALSLLVYIKINRNENFDI